MREIAKDKNGRTIRPGDTVLMDVPNGHIHYENGTTLRGTVHMHGRQHPTHGMSAAQMERSAKVKAEDGSTWHRDGEHMTVVE